MGRSSTEDADNSAFTLGEKDVRIIFSSLINLALKTMPAGSEYLAAMTKDVIANASAGYQQFNKQDQQVTEVAGAQVSDAVDQASPVAAQVSVTRVQ
jgi:hypothetical protein